MYLFIAQNGEVSPGIPVGFFGFVFVRCLCRFFGRFAQGSAETVNISGDFLAGELSEIFVFCSVTVTIFRILSVYLLLFIYLFFCWALIRHITQYRFFPVKFVKFLSTSILKNICEQLLLTKPNHNLFL